VNAAAARLTFPHPVNEVAARLVAAGVLAMTLVVAVLGQTWVLLPLAYGFLARVAAGPRYSPLGLLVTRVVVPRLGVPARPVPGPPKRFAQAIGAVLSATAVVLAFGLHEPGAARVVAALIAVAATLEAGLGLCIGCRIFAGLIRLGVVPERICLECADLSARRA
jgi:uncharacterized protein DUF4395